ncbi:MAG: methylated-DNA--[protein]-cysteine S-methyltransferase [Acidobacteria bacterium]|nr:methylated-DNA--[protein]-cysteine S-methyltransferase [Acidobacteriota bacterium]
MHFTYVDTPIGPLFVAGDHDALHEVSFSTGHQIREPREGWTEDAGSLRFATVQIDEYFAGTRRDFDLPLAMQGTDFQKRVWNELMEIPFGESRTYGEMAETLGSPGAARAVGRANATNHIPLIVPCHRVVGADGSLTGFGGGMPTKQWLLRFEGVLAPGADNTQKVLF